MSEWSAWWDCFCVWMIVLCWFVRANIKVLDFKESVRDSRTSGLVVKWNVAIVSPRVRFSAGASYRQPWCRWLSYLPLTQDTGVRVPVAELFCVSSWVSVVTTSVDVDNGRLTCLIRHDVGGYHTCLSRRIPGFESPWRKSFWVSQFWHSQPLPSMSFCPANTPPAQSMVPYGYRRIICIIPYPCTIPWT